MIISHKHKFIFVKTFKTAGSSVEKYLYDYLGPSDILRGSEHDNTPSLNAASKGRHKTAHEGWRDHMPYTLGATFKLWEAYPVFWGYP